MPSFTSLAIPALYQTSRQFVPRSMAATIRQAQFASKASKPDLVTYEEIDTLIHQNTKVTFLSYPRWITADPSRYKRQNDSSVPEKQNIASTNTNTCAYFGIPMA